MARKKAPNWDDIKTRYVVHAEKPADIAKDYSVSVTTIYNRACDERWSEERTELGRNLRDQEIDRRKRILEKTGLLTETMLDNIINAMPNMGATVQDGEGFPNKYHADTWKALVTSYVKSDEDEAASAGKLPDININFVGKEVDLK